MFYKREVDGAPKKLFYDSTFLVVCAYVIVQVSKLCVSFFILYYSTRRKKSCWHVRTCLYTSLRTLIFISSTLQFTTLKTAMMVESHVISELCPTIRENFSETLLELIVQTFFFNNEKM